MLPKLNVSLLYKNLLSLCVDLRHFPIVGDAEDSFAERDDDYGLADRLRRNVYTEAMRQAKRLQTTLEGIENADCEPIPLGILLGLQIQVRHLLSEFRRNADGAVTSRPWSGGTLPRLDRATPQVFQGTLASVKRSIEQSEADDPTLWTHEISKAALARACKISPKTLQRRIKSKKFKLHPDYTSTSRDIRVRLRGLPADAAEKFR